jgi:hypothetical protein
MGRGIGAMDPTDPRKCTVDPTTQWVGGEGPRMGQHIYMVLWILIPNKLADRCNGSHIPAERYCGSYYLMDQQKVVVDPTT